MRDDDTITKQSDQDTAEATSFDLYLTAGEWEPTGPEDDDPMRWVPHDVVKIGEAVMDGDAIAVNLNPMLRGLDLFNTTGRIELHPINRKRRGRGR